MPTTLHLIDRVIEVVNRCSFSDDPDLCREYGSKMRALDIARGKLAAELALDAGRAKPIVWIDEDRKEQSIPGKEWTEEDREKLQAIKDGRLTLDDLRMPAVSLPSDEPGKGDVAPRKGSPPCELALHGLIYPFFVDVLIGEAQADPVNDEEAQADPADIIIAKVLQELEKRPDLMEGEPIPYEYEMAVSVQEVRTFIVKRAEWQREELPSNSLNLTEREHWITRMLDRLHKVVTDEALFGENETKSLPEADAVATESDRLSKSLPLPKEILADSDLPPLDSENWVNQLDAVTILLGESASAEEREKKTGALRKAKYDSKRKTSDGQNGINNAGLIWRNVPTDKNTTLYHTPSLNSGKRT